MAEEKKEDKKIIIDEDWKTQAQKEKEDLAEKTEDKQKEEKKKFGHGPLPKGNLAALISMLVTQAFFAMGLLQIEGHEEKEPDLALAKYNIDMLEALEEKTKGNLTADEAKVLADTLTQLRMAFVKMSEAK